MRPETLQRILSATEELGYRPHAAARALSVGRTNTIGVISPSLTAPGYASMMGGIEEAAAALGYVVLWVHAADEDAAVRAQIERLASRVDGIIMASARGNGKALRALVTSHVPFLLLNRAGGKKYPSVIGDDAEGARLATAHLISLGHTRIAHVGGPGSVDTVARRLAGFTSALRQARIPPDPALLHETDLGEESAGEATRQLMAPDGPHPTAILYTTITTALGGLQALKSLRIDVPEQVSIVSFDDSPIADHLAVPLTTIRLPHAEMGDHAVRSLVEHLESDTELASEIVSVAPQLVTRHSTRRLAEG